MAPCFSNLVVFDPLKPIDTAESVIPELAEKWSWQDNYRNLPGTMVEMERNPDYFVPGRLYLDGIRSRA